MPFPFRFVCDLLEDLYNSHQKLRAKQAKEATIKAEQAKIIKKWFQEHDGQLHSKHVNVPALLSTLLPELRTDRVYSLKTPELSRILAKKLCVGYPGRRITLERWKVPGSGLDLGDCVKLILDETPTKSPKSGKVTVEEIDADLHSVAKKCRYSSRAVRSSKVRDRKRDDIGLMCLNLDGRDAKWLIRIVLKDLRPVVINPYDIYQAYDPLLHLVLQVQENFEAAITILNQLKLQAKVSDGRLSKMDLFKRLKPQIGVKIGRQRWEKGRSIEQCLKMGHGTMFCEEKIDGEYCQVQIDLSKGHEDCIQIYSKSCKDSTDDRKGLHEAIKQSLQIGHPSCKIKRVCVLEGELVVWSSRENKIMPFEKIRKYVLRSGHTIGTDMDSQRHSWDRLMIVYFDMTLLDDKSLLWTNNSERFELLRSVVTPVQGLAQLVSRQTIDFGDKAKAERQLRTAFAKCITAGGEGLVLKPDEPYFKPPSSSERLYASTCIKLKKGYIDGFGDVGDFAVVGARYDIATARTLGLENIKWTHFYVGCMTNKYAHIRWEEKPEFVIVNVVQLNRTQLEYFRKYCFPQTDTVEVNEKHIYNYNFSIQKGVDEGKGPTHAFPYPPVFDLKCFSFERKGNTNFQSLRFPVVTKIHEGRSYKECMSYDELQAEAQKEKGNSQPDSQDERVWYDKLLGLNPKLSREEKYSQETVSSHRSLSMSPGSPVAGPSRVGRMHPPQLERVEEEAEVPAQAHAETVEDLPVAALVKSSTELVRSHEILASEQNTEVLEVAVTESESVNLGVLTTPTRKRRSSSPAGSQGEAKRRKEVPSRKDIEVIVIEDTPPAVSQSRPVSHMLPLATAQNRRRRPFENSQESAKQWIVINDSTDSGSKSDTDTIKIIKDSAVAASTSLPATPVLSVARAQKRGTLSIEDSQTKKRKISDDPFVPSPSPSSLAFPASKRSRQAIAEAIEVIEDPPAVTASTSLAVKSGSAASRKRKGLSCETRQSQEGAKKRKSIDDLFGSSPKSLSASSPASPMRSRREPLGDITSTSQPKANEVEPHVDPDDLLIPSAIPDLGAADAPSSPLPVFSSSQTSYRTARDSTPEPPPSTMPSSPPGEIPDSQPELEPQPKSQPEPQMELQSDLQSKPQPEPKPQSKTQEATADSQETTKLPPDHKCALAYHSIYLAPDVVAMPWLHETLLPLHGHSTFIKDPKEWKTQSRWASRTQQIKRIMLVEYGRKQAMNAAAQLVEDAQLRSSSGLRLYVEMYDWRLLEAITKHEERRHMLEENGDVILDQVDKAEVREIFRKHRIGLA